MIKAFKGILGYEQTLIELKFIILKSFNLINFILKNHKNFHKKTNFF